MRSMLVTGGAGFIGANFVHYWAARHPDDRLIVLDALTYAGNRQSLTELESAQRLVFCHGNINDEGLLDDLFAEHRVDTVVHFAAESHVDRSIHAPNDFIETNIVGTHALLAAARRAWQPDIQNQRFHHVSTDEVYGSLGPDDPPSTERSRYAPNSPYSASKAAADHLVRAYCRTYGLPATMSNCSNNFGPFQFPEKLIPLAIVNILNGETIPVYGDGSNIRDWLFVADHCRAIDMILDGGRVGEMYNVGGNNEISNIDIVTHVCESMDARFSEQAEFGKRFPNAPPAVGQRCRDLITMVEDRAGHDQRYAIDFSKIQGELGYQPRYDLGAGIDATIDWYLSEESWWKSVMTGSYRQWLATNYRKRELS